MDDAPVLVMSFGADESLLAPALARLADDGLSVVVGPNLGGYPSVAQRSDAAVVLVAVGGAAWPVELTYPIEEFARRGQVVVVGVDANSRAPSTRNDLVYLDLGAWAGGPSATFDARPDISVRSSTAACTVTSDPSSNRKSNTRGPVSWSCRSSRRRSAS
jgi:hypothetical protein